MVKSLRVSNVNNKNCKEGNYFGKQIWHAINVASITFHCTITPTMQILMMVSMMKMMVTMMISILTKTEDITCLFHSENASSLNKHNLIPGIFCIMTSPWLWKSPSNSNKIIMILKRNPDQKRETSTHVRRPLWKDNAVFHKDADWETLKRQCYRLENSPSRAICRSGFVFLGHDHNHHQSDHTKAG